MRPARAAAFVAALAVTGAAPVRAQRDTTRARALDAVVVTAERTQTALGSVSSAVSRLDASDLARLPHATLADALRLAPGFALVDFDGLGLDPKLMVRGFYGGGEAEYVVVLVDGKPFNQLQTGVVAWDALPPLDAIAAVEIVRGSASALYGDAALGAVINVITRRPATEPRARWSVAAGTYGTWRASADLSGAAARRALTFSGGVDRTDGFRAHAARTTGRVSGGITLAERSDTRLALSARSHWRELDEPGPLLESLLATDRDGSDPLFRFDDTRDRDHALTLEAERRVGALARLSGSITGEYWAMNAVRTLALAPGFGDTKERETRTGRALSTLQLDLGDTPLPGTDHVIVGADVSHGSLDSKYFRILTGDRDAYRAAGGGRDAIDARGDVTRTAVAMFAQYTLQPAPALRMSLGARYDHLDDDFEPRAPSDGSPAGASHSAFSPKAGINLRYLQSERSTGSAYLTASRSFKAPTLDQSFDQRSIPVPFPPFSITTSNALLDPQHGASGEGGLYHSLGLRGGGRLTVTFSAYQIDLKDELDFDVQTFRYVNIGRSRHRGIESGLAISGPGTTSAFANYTLQSATARSGPSSGRALKAIPKHVFASGVSVTPRVPLRLRLVASHSRDMYLDDANTVRLPAFTRVDAHLGYRVRAVDVFVEATNLFDRRYNTTGFLDPAGSGEPYFHPAAGRVLQLGIRRGG